MATHCDFAHEPDDTSGLAAWTDEHGNFFCHPDFEDDLDRLRRDEGNAAQRRQRRLQRVAVGRATGLTPDQFRRIARIHERVIVAAGVMLLFWMALGIIAAAFGGRL